MEEINTLKEQPVVAAQRKPAANSRPVCTNARSHAHTHTHTTVSRSQSWCYQRALRHRFWRYFETSISVQASRTPVDAPRSSPHSVQPFSGTTSFAVLERSETEVPRSLQSSAAQPHRVILASQMATAHNRNTARGSASATRARRSLSHRTASRAILKC